MKKIKKFILYILLFVFAFIIILLVFKNTFLPDINKLCLSCIYVDPQMNLNSHKIPDELYPSYKEAIKYFPELEQSIIEIRFESISSTMQTQPAISFQKKSLFERKYIIKVNNDFEENETLDYREMTNEILIGWLGHELSHIIDYKNRSTISLLGFGVNYLASKDFRSEVENFADKVTIYRGLGDELLLGVIYSTQGAKISNKYKSKLLEDYYSPKELERIIEDYNERCNKKMPATKATMSMCPLRVYGI